MAQQSSQHGESPFEVYYKKVRGSEEEIQRSRRQQFSKAERCPSPQTPPPAAITNSHQRPQPVRYQRRPQQQALPPSKPAYCENAACRHPEIEIDEEPGRGPRGITLCRKCYRRYKLEKKHAREEQRQVTDVWKTPKRKQSPSKKADDTQSGIDQGILNTLSRAEQDIDSSSYTHDVPQTISPVKMHPKGEVTKSSSINVSPADLPRSTEIDLEKGGRAHGFSIAEKDVESRYSDEQSDRGANQRRHLSSSYEEAEFYKYGKMEEDHDRCADERSRCCSAWSFRQKCIVFGVSLVALVLIVTLVAITVTRSHHHYQYTPSFLQVNSTSAFDSHGATRSNVNDTNDGMGAGHDKYVYYSGNVSNFPSSDKWVSFNQMWQANLETMQHSCSRLQQGTDNSPEILQDMHDAIQDRANASLVDHRLILAVVLQESKGCVRVQSTTSYGGVRNPGLMQSHNGHSYDAKHSRLSILNMIQDGTQGTTAGDGLVQLLNTYGDPYKAARAYNSGYIPTSGDLSDAAGATACYVSDIANRLTGWVNDESTCPGAT